MGTARIPTVQISRSVRATGDRPCASYQAPAVIASHSAARGAIHGRFDRDVGGQLVEASQHAFELGQLGVERDLKSCSRNTPESPQS